MAARDARHRTTWGNRFRFLTRFVGLTGVLAVAAGAALYASAFPPFERWTLADATAAAEGGRGLFAQVAVWTLAGGAVAVALALVVEVLGGFVLVAGRRTAANTTATLGTAAAAALLFFVNAYSFTHHARYDFTREKKYTLPAELAEKLRTLRPESPTTIVVLQNHNLFGSLSTRRDSFTKAAEEKVTEKVTDLVDLFREFGPRFHVEVLDTEAYGYKKKLAALTKDTPELKAAIDAAPENSIFFHANKRVQRMSFNEFLQLDKSASERDDGHDNLVLLPQGVENFARRVLAVQERRPKVAVCVVHEWLSTVGTTGQYELSLAGLKRSLTDHGFDVVDIILKKNWETSPDPEPAAYTVDESKLERLEAELDSARNQVRAAQNDVKVVAAVRKSIDELQAGSTFRDRAEILVELQRVALGRGWQEVAAAYRKWSGEESRKITEENEPELRAAATAALARQAARAEQEVKDAEKARAEADELAKAAARDERAADTRRIDDVKAKFAGLLKDVDLLVLPRFTLQNATIRRGIDPGIHTLSKPQLEVVKDFMKQGKPVLACLGSLSGQSGFDPEGVDGLERLVAERGIELGRDTVMYDTEAKALAAIRSGRQLGEGAAEVPPLVIGAAGPGAGGAKPNAVGAAFRLTGRSVDQKLDLQLPAPRPVYVARGWQDRLEYAAEFVFTGPDSWNESDPFYRRDRATGRVTYVPRYEPTLNADAKWGTNQAERRGPFPVGVAVEGKIPASWVNEDYDRAEFAAGLLAPLDGVLAAGLTAAATKLDRPTQRLIVFGSGNLFAGPKLEPAQEKLLLHSANWLTGRADRLPQAELPAWSFPRVQMTDREFHLWRYGTAIGLPLAAIYLGLIVTMLRRMR